ncbi:hypothetical protein [Sandarakinorhabdus sp. DWP1-3-1]|uniref:hypothetical protein n=1 Tax=Sandarakinorhabdus sp. DWP1-3-1 TaxID=2804627 RepID=UPI003CF54893
MSRLRRQFEDATGSSQVPFIIPRNQRVQMQIDRLRWTALRAVWLGGLLTAAVVLFMIWKIA